MREIPKRIINPSKQDSTEKQIQYFHQEAVPKLADTISKARSRSREVFRGEVECDEVTEELVGLALVAVQYFAQLFGSDNQESANEILDALHFFELDDYIKETSRDDSVNGFYNGNTDSIVVQFFGTEPAERAQQFSTVVHELLHYFSARADVVSMRRNEPDHAPHRIGYQINNFFGTEPPHMHFRGLNECITRSIQFHLLIENEEKVMGITGCQIEDLHQLEDRIVRNAEFMNFLQKEIYRVAPNSSRESTSLIMGYFTGNLLQLRRLEQRFGKGSIRLLGEMDIASLTDDFLDDKTRDILRYFFQHDELSEQERQSILQKYLAAGEPAEVPTPAS